MILRDVLKGGGMSKRRQQTTKFKKLIKKTLQNPTNIIQFDKIRKGVSTQHKTS
jgi:hypothetical protein